MEAIKRHDWVTSNGVHVLGPCVEAPVFIDEGDISNAISLVKALVSVSSSSRVQLESK